MCRFGPMKVLVTGATGFVGSHIVRKLIAAGHSVRILKRRNSPMKLLKGLSFETALGDVTEKGSLLQAMAGVEAVFHSAGLVSFWSGDTEPLYRINSDGTRHVVEACLEQKVKRLVHTSSVSAIGRPPPGEIGDESLKFNWWPWRIPYCNSKFLGEEEVRRGVQRGLDAVILNPAVIFGPGDLHYHGGAMVLQMARGNIRYYFKGGCSTCDVEDVAEAHLAALKKGRTGQRYILGGENVSWKEMFRVIAEMVGVEPPQKKIPIPFLSTYARSLDWISRLTHRRPILTPEEVRISQVPVFFDSGKASRELGYRITPLRESLRKTWQWYRREGLIR